MSHVASAQTLGPFLGGLNTFSDPSFIQNAEVAECVNMELDLNGSLVQRPAIQQFDYTAPFSHMTFVGSAVVNDKGYLVACNIPTNKDVSAFTSLLLLFDGKDFKEMAGTAGILTNCTIQLRNLVYIIASPLSPNPGGRYDITTNTFVADSSMPRGDAAVFAKGRVWIVPGPDAVSNYSRLQFTDPVINDTLDWNAENIIDVSPGDGQKLVDIKIYNDNLILFKNDSTWVLAYDLQPVDAVLRCVNTVIGASANRCVVAFENSLFVFHEGKVYEMINYDFEQVNNQVPFEIDGTKLADAGYRFHKNFMTLFGDRLFVKILNSLYVYGLQTKTWSKWESKNEELNDVGPLVLFPNKLVQGQVDRYFSGGCFSASASPMYLVDGRTSTNTERTLLDIATGSYTPIKSRVKTKIYDFDEAMHFKKLLWWGADVVSNQDLTAVAIPIVPKNLTTWDELAEHTWDEVGEYTWDYLLQTPPDIISDVDVPAGLLRRFYKFHKTLRFRQIQFKLELEGNGATTTGPPRLFTMSAIVGVKQTVGDRITTNLVTP